MNTSLPSTMSLLSLPNELLVQVYSYLDLPSSLDLAFSCSRLQNILITPGGFKTLLKIIKVGDNKMIELLIEFLGVVLERKTLVQKLSEKILQEYKGTDLDEIHARWWTLGAINVTLSGFFLLSKLARRCHLALPVVKGVSFETMEGAGMLALAPIIQEQEQKVIQLMVSDIICHTEEEGTAAFLLLSSCSNWMSFRLVLLDDVGSGTWEGLARLVGEDGTISLVTTWEVMARWRKEEFRKILQATTWGYWKVDGRLFLCDEDREELVDMVNMLQCS